MKYLEKGILISDIQNRYANDFYPSQNIKYLNNQNDFSSFSSIPSQIQKSYILPKEKPSKPIEKPLKSPKRLICTNATANRLYLSHTIQSQQRINGHINNKQQQHHHQTTNKNIYLLNDLVNVYNGFTHKFVNENPSIRAYKTIGHTTLSYASIISMKNRPLLDRKLISGRNQRKKKEKQKRNKDKKGNNNTFKNKSINNNNINYNYNNNNDNNKDEDIINYLKPLSSYFNPKPVQENVEEEVKVEVLRTLSVSENGRLSTESLESLKSIDYFKIEDIINEYLISPSIPDIPIRYENGSNYLNCFNHLYDAFIYFHNRKLLQYIAWIPINDNKKYLSASSLLAKKHAPIVFKKTITHPQRVSSLYANFIHTEPEVNNNNINNNNNDNNQNVNKPKGKKKTLEKANTPKKSNDLSINTKQDVNDNNNNNDNKSSSSPTKQQDFSTPSISKNNKSLHSKVLENIMLNNPSKKEENSNNIINENNKPKQQDNKVEIKSTPNLQNNKNETKLKLKPQENTTELRHKKKLNDNNEEIKSKNEMKSKPKRRKTKTEINPKLMPEEIIELTPQTIRYEKKSISNRSPEIKNEKKSTNNMDKKFKLKPKETNEIKPKSITKHKRKHSNKNNITDMKSKLKTNENNYNYNKIIQSQENIIENDNLDLQDSRRSLLSIPSRIPIFRSSNIDPSSIKFNEHQNIQNQIISNKTSMIPTLGKFEFPFYHMYDAYETYGKALLRAPRAWRQLKRNVVSIASIYSYDNKP
ncbi:hypothetical protein BCR32DRAFT_296526 [Anaeromyces robustus]|uniref:Uncharacterized protein n=1 Tax=Anaeromyces robustus TaxID=1754192 RepID=A0A1Y1WR55_9FUNG|nr:hypothetical protein BCR32DRAFT_296526 [Anaeromyces robustus]|eukprot:ORX76023.1 hypothetical protein BCR32DRAFT_296526 [Anaeromyces robustus]